MPTLGQFAQATGTPKQRRWADVYKHVRGMVKLEKPKVTPPAIIKVSPQVEEVAKYMVRDFHDWSLPEYYLEPGFQRLVGQKSRQINVHYKELRDDWEPDFKRALDAWEEFGFEFIEVDDPQIAEITVDDEVRGAFARRGFRYMGRRKNGLPVIRANLREINIWKEWPSCCYYDAMLHELGHVLGLGHPGPYNGQRPSQPFLKGDNKRNTIMSYFGGNVRKLGDADKLAIDLIYNQ